MTALQDLAREAFAPGGALSRAADEFLPRQGQLDMAVAVARTIEEGGALVVEAGTGVGKTFSYLVPALLSGERHVMPHHLHAVVLPVMRHRIMLNFNAQADGVNTDQVVGDLVKTIPLDSAA